MLVGRVPRVKLPLSFLCGVKIHQLPDASTYDNTSRPLAAGKLTQGSLPKSFITQTGPLSPGQVVWMTQSPYPSNHMVGISGLASPQSYQHKLSGPTVNNKDTLIAWVIPRSRDGLLGTKASQILHYTASVMYQYDMFVTVQKSTLMCGPLPHDNFSASTLPKNHMLTKNLTNSPRKILGRMGLKENEQL